MLIKARYKRKLPCFHCQPIPQGCTTQVESHEETQVESHEETHLLDNSTSQYQTGQWTCLDIILFIIPLITFIAIAIALITYYFTSSSKGEN